MLGYYHPKGPMDIPDPLNFSDPKGYDKCYWMLYKSMKNLINLLKEEEEAEAKKKPKIVKLADPTVFTITSPSAWQKNKLQPPEVSLITIQMPCEPQKIVLVTLPDPHPSQPQEPPPEISDTYNEPQCVSKALVEHNINNEDIFILVPNENNFEDNFVCRFKDLLPSPPQPPSVEVVDIINFQNEYPVNKILNHLLPPVLTFHRPLTLQDDKDNKKGVLLLSPPQPPENVLLDEVNKPSIDQKSLNERSVESVLESFPHTGISISISICCRMSPPPTIDPLDDVLDKPNKICIVNKKFILDDIDIEDHIETIHPISPSRQMCNLRQRGKKPIHPRHVISCTHLHLLVSWIFSMNPPQLDLEYLPSPEPMARKRGDIFDDVRHFRSFMK